MDPSDLQTVFFPMDDGQPDVVPQPLTVSHADRVLARMLNMDVEDLLFERIGDDCPQLEMRP